MDENNWLNVNGKKVLVNSEDKQRKLIDFLRNSLGLTGTKNGCEIGACGACTVLVNNLPIRSCIKSVNDALEHEILTIEGLVSKEGKLHPLQQSFLDFGAVQCGFCSSGMILAAHALLLKNSRPSREEIKKAIATNLCRCTGYKQIIDAIENASIFYR